MTPRGDYRVSVTKDYLVFSSAHFITFAGHRCEGLHGHNYRVRVTIEGALNQESWFVFDFVELKGIMKRLCDEIDHLVLLPLESAPGWLRFGSHLNPLTYVVEAERALFAGTFPLDTVAYGAIASALVAAFGLVVGLRAMRASS